MNKKFINVQTQYRLRRTYDDKTLAAIEPNLGPNERLHVPVFHDESICKSNDLQRRVWVKNGKIPLRKKGEGCAIHISDFIVEQTGRISLSTEQRQHNMMLLPEQQLKCVDAREIIYPGKNSDGWWNMERLIAQVRLTVNFFFEQKYTIMSNL